ncbi:hypothetical protein [Aquicella lusitana]|uniref:hypothetical protein n=1 Tax=Aquicella lusitana TaxID=254246 RepID=UPI0014753B11|nr:hypothetical protein [Aquicella lusitana]
MQQGRCVIINEKSPLFISNSKKIEINKLKKVEKDGKQYVVIGKDSDGEYLLEIKVP